jgi:MarR family transcriptional regulator, organic hydroperoxide resistance regulator
MDEQASRPAVVLDAEPVPHATPLVTGGGCDDDGELNQQIFDVFARLIKYAHDLGQAVAAEFGLAGSDAMALIKLEAPMTMKELGTKLGCDPSFITTIADALEKQGLARREPSQRDRRSKNLVLTPEGTALRDQMCAEFVAKAPWCTALNDRERRCLLDLARKMLGSPGGGDGVTTAAAASS